MKKLFIGIGIIAIVIILLLIYQNQKPALKKTPIDNKPIVKIGATLQLTGEAGLVGQTTQTAMDWILEEINLNPNNKYTYKIIYEDNQMSPQKAALNTHKLINVDKVVAVFSLWGILGNVVSDIAEKQNVMSFSSTFGDFSSKGKYSYNIAPTYEDAANAMVTELKRRDIKSVALFVDTSEIQDQFAEVEKQIHENSDIKIIFNEKFKTGEKDYRAAIIKAAALKPDMYLISGYPPSPLLFMKQLKEITEKNNHVTGIDVQPEIDDKYRSIANGQWYVDSTLNGTTQFQEKLKAEKGITAQSGSGVLPAGLKILITAIENTTGDINDRALLNEQVKDWVINNVKDYDTPAGKLTIMPNGKIKTTPTIKQIKNGKSVDIES